MVQLRLDNGLKLPCREERKENPQYVIHFSGYWRNATLVQVYCLKQTCFANIVFAHNEVDEAQAFYFQIVKSAEIANFERVQDEICHSGASCSERNVTSNLLYCIMCMLWYCFFHIREILTLNGCQVRLSLSCLSRYCMAFSSKVATSSGQSWVVAIY